MIEINNYFDLQLKLPAGDILNCCGIEDIIMNFPKDMTDCGIKCALYDDKQCDFFIFESPHCYLVSYNLTEGLSLIDNSSELTTYHNMGNYEGWLLI